MKKLVVILSVSLVILISAASYLFFNRGNQEAVVPDQEQSQTADETKSNDEINHTKTIKIIATGDMIPHDTVNLRADNSLDGYLKLIDEPIHKILKSGDITVCNQESPSAGSSLGISGYPSFNAPFAFAEALNKAGCNAITLANNHIADRGEQGVLETIKFWKKQSNVHISGVGEEKNSVSFIDVKGIKIALVSMTEFSNAGITHDLVNFLTENNIKEVMEKAKKADYIIVAPHWGNEDYQLTNLQREYARIFIDNGADLIIGNGPHLVQKFEIIKNKPVYYSLGNALSTQLGADQLTGIFAIVELNITNQKVKLAEFGYLPVYMHYEWTPAQERNEDLLARENLKLMPLESAQSYLNKTRFNTDVEERMKYVKARLNYDGYLKLYSPNEF